jgi:FKBP-type peptidyl-prolyl cis-trans isomerase FklB
MNKTKHLTSRIILKVKTMRLLKILLFTLLNVAFLKGFTQNVDQKLNNLTDSLYYSYGVQLAEMIKTRLPEWDADIIAAGLKESLTGNGRLTLEQCQEVAQQFAAVEIEKLKAEGIKYQMEYGKNPDVITTASGLMYKTLVEGSGNSPRDTSKVTVHYTGRLINGTVFDSSVERGEPSSFRLNGVIKGWTEGVQLMKVGGKTEFVISAELGYGAQTKGKIPAYSTLIFEIELISIQ